jgi:cbb3-type cytochrome oxidase subunit 3
LFLFFLLSCSFSFTTNKKKKREERKK